MRRTLPQLLCQIYTALVLPAAAGILPEGGLSYLIAALTLMLVIIYITVRPQPPRVNIVLFLVMIFLTPLILAPPLDRITILPSIARQVAAIVFTLPVFYLLDSSLRENGRQSPSFREGKGERHTTRTYASLMAAALAAMLTAPVVNRLILLSAGIAFFFYLLGVLLWILFSIPHRPFTADTLTKKIIAGTTGNIIVNITNNTPVEMRVYLSPAVPWVQVTPPQNVLSRGSTSFNLSFTPPLAGQSCPRLQVSAMDPRGLIQINQWLEPVRLHIIPRAKYAEWLAKKYLEQTGSGAISIDTARIQPLIKPKTGVEYQESRTYQPGDPLRDIDWKHTLKLSQLIVREYQDAGERAAIIAVNLAAADEEAMDKLAFNLITAALTLARENIPTALAAYNHQKVITSTGIIQPQEMLTRVLSLVKEITIVKFTERLLEPMDVAKIRRNIRQLQQTESEPAQRLLEIFNFEHRSIEEVARNHPATLALAAATRNVPTPAIILLVSPLNHDAEAVLITAEKLARRNINTMPVETA